MKAIYLKEMRSYFHSLAAYIYFALFIAATGVYFSVICMSYGYTASEQIEKQGHHGFSFKRKKKADSKGTEQAETAEEDK